MRESIGDTPSQLGQIQAADAIIVNDKIVTRDDYLKVVAERDQYIALISMLREWAVSVVKMVSPDEKDLPLVCQISDLVMQGKMKFDKPAAPDADKCGDALKFAEKHAEQILSGAL